MAGLGDLVVRLSAETAQFTAALDKASYQAQKNFDKMASGAKTVVGAFAALTAGTSLVNFIQQQIDLADQLGKLSQKVGVSVEELSKLQYAAKLSDVAVEQLQVGLVKLGRGAVEASQGTGEAKEAFDAMGISVKNTDGTLKSNSDLLNEVADRFATYEDGANKAELAYRLFGKSGTDLIPLLNAGSQGLKESGDQLERLGGVVTKEAAMNAELFNDNMTRLGETVSAFGKSIANAALPYLIRLSEELVVARANGLGFIDTLKILGTTNPTGAKNIAKEIEGVNQQIEKLNKGQMTYAELLTYGGKAGIEKELESLNKRKNALVQLRATMEKPVDDALWKAYSDGVDDTKKKAPAPLSAPKKEKAKSTKDLTDVTMKFTQAIEELMDKQQMLIEKPLMTDEQIKQREFAISLEKQYQDALSGVAKYLVEGSYSVDTYNKKVAEINKTYEEAKVLGQQVFEQQRQLNESWLYGANVALVQYLNQSKNVAALTGDIVSNAMSNLENTLVSLTMRTTSVADAFRQMTSSILQDIARIMIRQSVVTPIASALSGLVSSFFAPSTNYLMAGAGNLGGATLGAGKFGSTLGGSYTGTALNYQSGMRAFGGDVTAGNSYLVGERGAEVFTPNTNGFITSSDSMGSTNNVVVNVNMNDNTVSSQDGKQLGLLVGNAVKAELIKQKRAGGLLA